MNIDINVLYIYYLLYSGIILNAFGNHYAQNFASIIYMHAWVPTADTGINRICDDFKIQHN